MAGDFNKDSPFFYPECSSADATLILSEKPATSFLVRSKKNEYIISYNDFKGNVRHLLIPTNRKSSMMRSKNLQSSDDIIREA